MNAIRRASWMHCGLHNVVAARHAVRHRPGIEDTGCPEPRQARAPTMSQCSREPMRERFAFRISVAGSGGRSSPADRVSREPPGGMPAWDAIVIGSGFGGAMAAHALVTAGHRVLMLERGGWVARGPQNWTANGVGLTTPHYTTESPYEVMSKATLPRRFVAVRRWSVRLLRMRVVPLPRAGLRSSCRDRRRFWRGVAVRIRRDRAVLPRAEQLLGVAGGRRRSDGATTARRTLASAPLSRPAQVIADAATRLGLNPFRIPLAISYRADENRRGCMRCGTCDGYACAAEAKNDVATAIIPTLIANGMTLRPNTVCVRTVRDGSRVGAVECVDRITGEQYRLTAPVFVLAAGALATPHLLLASELAERNRAGHCVGRYSCATAAVVFGVYARQPNPQGTFDKQIAIHDFYFGAPEWDPRHGPLGGIQQLTRPSASSAHTCH